MDSPHSTTMVILSSTAFEEFQRAFDGADDDLRWIRAVTGHEYISFPDDVHRFKRNVNPLEALLSSFGAENGYSESDQLLMISDIANGDAWYSNFRTKECKNGDCLQRTFKYTEKPKKGKRGKRPNGSLKVHKPQPIESVPDVDDDEDEIPENLSKSGGKSDPDYEDYDNMKNSFSKSEKKLEKFRLNEANRLKTGSKSEKKNHKFNMDSKRYEQNSNGDVAKEVNYDFIFDKRPEPARENSQDEHIELKDQVEKTQNDLSHEADYKLSKIEQEAMEKKSSNREWPLKHPDYQIALLMQQKDHDVSKSISNSYNQKRSIDQEGFLDDPSSLDPAAEIKLKVSSRLMEKGLSPSLPSDSLRPEQSRFEKRKNIEYEELGQDGQKSLWSRSVENTKRYDDMHREHRRNKRGTLEREENKSTTRKLMTLNDYDSIDSNRIEDSGNENKEIQGSQDNNENNIKEVKTNFKSPTYYNPELQINNIETGENNLNDFPEKLAKDADGLTIDFSDALLKSSDTDSSASCADSSKLVKVGSKSNQTKPSENNETCGEYIKSGSVITINKSLKLADPNTQRKFNTSSTPKSNTDSKPNPDSIPKSKSSSSPPSQMSLKFGVAFNVTVVNGTTQIDKSKPSISINKKKRKRIPGYDGSKLLMINKRDIIFPPLPAWLSKRDEKPTRTDKSTEDSDIDVLMSGKLTAEVVNAVFRLVKENDDFSKDISPGLRSHKIKTCTGCNNLNAIKNDKNSDKINKSEEMLREVMETINSIIEREIQNKLCVPLCPTLKHFYKTILQSRAENEKKPKSTKRRLAAEVQNRNKVTKREASDEPTIRRKYSVVKKLLNQYENLPSDDQVKAKDAKDLLQVHLRYLNDLERAKRRIKRNNARNIFKPINVESRETGPAEMSPEFVKLAKTVDIMRKNTPVDDEAADYTFLEDDDYS